MGGGGRLYWRGGIFQRRRNLFKIGGGRLCKIINGGRGGAVAYDGGGSPLTTEGVQSLTTGGGGGGAVHFWHTENTFC